MRGIDQQIDQQIPPRALRALVGMTPSMRVSEFDDSRGSVETRKGWGIRLNRAVSHPSPPLERDESRSGS
jgi:hypothetical protein